MFWLGPADPPILAATRATKSKSRRVTGLNFHTCKSPASFESRHRISTNRHTNF